MTAPTAMNCQNGSTLMKTRPYWMTAMTSAPAIVPAIVPDPPNRLAPPMTTAAIEFEQQRLARLGGPGGEAAGVHRSGDAGHDGREQVDLER